MRAGRSRDGGGARADARVRPAAVAVAAIWAVVALRREPPTGLGLWMSLQVSPSFSASAVSVVGGGIGPMGLLAV